MARLLFLMSFLFKKKETGANGDEVMQTQPSQHQPQPQQLQQQQQQRSAMSSPQLLQHSQHGSEHNASAALSSSSFTGPTPMSTSPLTTSTSPIAREAPSLITNHFAAPAPATTSPPQQQQQPQQMAYTLQSIPPFSGHVASASSASSSSSSSSLPPMSDQSGGGQPLSSSLSSAALPAASSSSASSASSSSSFPSFSNPPSPSSRESSSSVDLTPFPVMEEKPSDDAIILRAHFSSIPSISRHLFTIGDTLGTGTFGRVRLVSYHHPPLSAKTLHFALKMLKKSEIIRLKQVEHIKAEKAILSRICHPFIVNLFSSFQDERYLFMLMEYVIGGELFSQLRKVGRFSNDTARFYAAEIVLALQYLHSKDIVYRDLKPENLLIDREGHIKITDFGSDAAQAAAPPCSASPCLCSPLLLMPSLPLQLRQGGRGPHLDPVRDARVSRYADS